ncbi:uncharacterized protein CIMG_03871 [Coccidioides immitis RS]|uniref:Uncharacterized protein n=1 Tax=Coccidioides immitis (strain RS) TaxID=246410 RepID=J3KCA7_COCIM|nr:uncharacterized protein CIMG_03871 [Coccidioides immitis RS]EAS32847.3 hypothetical protein CIMG_03871 [Coccidioides immitis RS]
MSIENAGKRETSAARVASLFRTHFGGFSSQVTNRFDEPKLRYRIVYGTAFPAQPLLEEAAGQAQATMNYGRPEGISGATSCGRAPPAATPAANHGRQRGCRQGTPPEGWAKAGGLSGFVAPATAKQSP